MHAKLCHVLIFKLTAVSDAPQKLSVLESNIVKLEQASTRADAIQSFADLYESAGAKTLLVRTKYKYVRIQGIDIYLRELFLLKILMYSFLYETQNAMYVCMYVCMCMVNTSKCMAVWVA